MHAVCILDILFEMINVTDQHADKSQFILQVTHELRGPIAAVLGYHEMLLKGISGEISPEVRRTLEKANLRLKRLLDIVDEMKISRRGLGHFLGNGLLINAD